MVRAALASDKFLFALWLVSVAYLVWFYLTEVRGYEHLWAWVLFRLFF